MKKRIIIDKLILLICLAFSSLWINAQTMSRAQMMSYITASVYQNSNHAVTGQILQNVLLNQNRASVNLKSDTNNIIVFDTGYTYYRGMAVVSGADSLYRCTSSMHHGAWTLSDFRFIKTIGGANYRFNVQNGITYSIGASDFDGQTIILMTNTASSTDTIPDAGMVPIGVPLTIKAPNIFNRNTLSFVLLGSATIDGSTNYLLTSTGKAPMPSIKMITDGTNWYIIP